MNSYEERQEAKRERLQKAAKKRRAQATAKFETGTKELKAIPFGQPILLGHHSERGDRAYRGRAVAKIEASFKLSDEAARLEARADNIGTGGISSDDPEAVAKLEDKLLKLEEAHAHMANSNRDARAQGIEKPFASYQLTNCSANIRRIKDRIAHLEHRRTALPMETKIGNGWKMYEDKDANRIAIRFDARMDSSLVKSLRGYGFLWSPTRKEWVRNATNARFSVDRAYQLLSVL